MSAVTLMRSAVSSTSEGRSQRQIGERWVRALSLVSVTVATWMLCTLMGGTWMFVARNMHPHEALVEADPLSLAYVFLALFASVLLVPSLLGLLTQAARANLGGREEHLAVLRLIGATAGEVRGMMILESLRQALVGLMLGSVLYVVTCPAWSLLAFQEKRVGAWEMLTWWVIPVAWIVVLVLAACSVWLALRRVAVTPLGVTKKIPPKGQSVITLVLSVVGAVLLYRYLSSLTIAPEADALEFVVVLVVAGGILTVNALIAVGVIQLLARLSYRVPGAANYVATRRVGRGAKTTWKRVTALYFVAFIGGVGGWFSAVPEIDEAPALMMIAGDIPSGVVITVVFATLLMVSSTLLTQALGVVEQKQLTKSLYFIGAPAAFHTKVAVREVGIPMLVVALLGFGMGSLMGSVMVFAHVNVLDKVALFGALVVVALIGCVLAVLGTGRLREKVLAQTGREKD
ncbi:FtsX-like permease family protein [Corynebacterium sp. zg912]|uniref:FtsX-like permease family protein n=1 Tax=Corynebacterium wankanglinii TaxID=2735136 RepID=A0A7H0KAB1_9CORY|nr:MULTISPECIES: FtsX-like permease family protein [Corynebacterium]MBA1836445.1 FtsX-like permease family protein [Corynebacterium wankanglinii]MCR5928442.1 FtsX-like permease family protein [Corynebacterium sp. zg912]QNP94227.1 FtsX-like permease family protein [Corynebacterium wankanglinii]